MNRLGGSQETQHYAFFDVDGTVIARDSFRILMRELIVRQSRLRLLIASLLCVLLAVGRVIGLVGKTQFKSALLWSATVGLSKKEALSRIARVVDQHIKPLWFAEMNAELKKLRNDGLQICYISASGEFWLRRLLNAMDSGQKQIIGSRLMSCCGGLTLRGKNCLGEEKIRRLRSVIPSDCVWSVAYSDHRADLPLLLASRRRVVVNPSEKNLRAFRKSLGEDGFVLVEWTPSDTQPS